MRVLFYGRLADAIGPELQLELPPGCSVASIRERLASEYPTAAATLTTARALTCVDGSFVRDDYLVTANDRVEFLPPLSGG